MTDIPPIYQPNSQSVPKETTGLSKFWSKVPEKIRVKLEAFYFNKKIFLPVAIAFGVVFLVMIAGLLFGQRTTRTKILPVTTPVPTTSPPAIPGDSLSQIQLELVKLKDQIFGIDVNQSRLQPPPINYNIKF